MEDKRGQHGKASDASTSDGSLQLPEGPAIAFRNLKNAKLLAMDIGGSLTKIAYYSTVPVKRSVVYPAKATTEKQQQNGNNKSDEGGKVCYETREGARLHFISFETRQIEKCLDYVRKTLMTDQQDEMSDSKTVTAGKRIYVSGGGAYKYCDLIENKLNLTVAKVDEMDCICAGSNFLIRNIADEIFTYDRVQNPPYSFHKVQEKDVYPYLLVIIGSGVSILKVESESKFERIGGTATGGGTFWGLGAILTGAKGFDELLDLATQGDFRQVDMLVKDIYGDRGNEYTSLGLSPDIIASSFGKAIHYDPSSSNNNLNMSKADMARSLLYMVSNDIGQISTLYAMLHNVKNIYFGGFFMRHHPVSLHTISYAVNYWSKGKVKANFLRHEGYLGAIGAFLKGCEAENADIEVLKPFGNLDNFSWTENLYGSTPSFQDPIIGSGAWQSGSKTSTLDGIRKRTKSASASMAGTSSSYPASPLVRPTSRNSLVSDGEEKNPIDDDNRSESDWSADNDSSSTSLIEVTHHLEIDRYENRLGACPLLKQPDSYIADTVDLTRDDEARDYWLACFEDSLPKFADRALASQTPSEDSSTSRNSSSAADDKDNSLQTSNKNNGTNDLKNVTKRCEQFKETFLARIQTLRNQPFAHGNLTVRSLLDMREHCLSEFDFHDPYLKQKRLENDQAFALFPELLDKLHGLEWDALQEALAIGMLAGNVFDWGAKEVALLMENRDGGLKFDDALSFVRPRPWLVDDLDTWKSRLRLNAGNEPHKCAAIFIDNSGVDVILGILPFVEHLLSRGTEVLLCANNRPVLNDVTYAELVLIVQRAARDSPTIEKSLKTGKLLCLNSGQSSACLDLARLNSNLIDQMIQRKVDLIVLEGMGRAVHTNYYANFNCECLKVAVLKNRWLAKRLGGEMFAVVFKYEPKQTSDSDELLASKQ